MTPKWCTRCPVTTLTRAALSRTAALTPATQAANTKPGRRTRRCGANEATANRTAPSERAVSKAGTVRLLASDSTSAGIISKKRFVSAKTVSAQDSTRSLRRPCLQEAAKNQEDPPAVQ